jgi:hypothetical protein
MPRDAHPTPFVIHPSDELGKNIDLKNLSRNLWGRTGDALSLPKREGGFFSSFTLLNSSFP